MYRMLFENPVDCIDAIDAMIQAAQKQFPGYRLRLVSGIESHNSYVRFSWSAGGTPEGGTESRSW